MQVTAADFAVLHLATTALDTANVPYVVGGGTVVVLYGRHRRTKDFDVFLNRKQLPRAMNALSRAGFTTTDTEKNWLYKAWYEDTLVDLIAESRGGMSVTAETIRHARIVSQYGYFFRVMGPEDVLARKILTLTEGRPDWHDAISIIARQQGRINWDYLLHLTRHHLRRVLSFLLFARTEMHAPPGQARTSADELFTGDAPGLIPDWLVFRLMSQLMRGETSGEAPLPALTYLPKAA